MTATLLDYTESDGDVEYSFSDFHIEDIPLAVASDFFEEYHYSAGCGNAAMTWGLYHNPTGQLIGAIAFQTPISENTRKKVFEVSGIDGDDEPGLYDLFNRCQCDHIDENHRYREHVTELHRLAIIDEAPQNTATWLISRALDRLKEHKPKYWAAISFADRTEGHDGTVYQAANADYTGTTRPRTCYIDEDGRLRTRRQCGENISVEEARDRGWDVVTREAKHRYVFWTPDPYGDKDELRRRAVFAGIELQEYPTND